MAQGQKATREQLGGLSAGYSSNMPATPGKLAYVTYTNDTAGVLSKKLSRGGCQGSVTGKTKTRGTGGHMKNN